MRHPHPPFDFHALRERLARRGIHPVRDPSEFEFSAEIIGLTPGGVGYDHCAALLHRLRSEADTATGGEYAVMATRHPGTHERRGYAVHTDDQQTATKIAAVIQRLIP